MKAIQPRLVKQREKTKDVRKRAMENIDDEPTGKLTEPIELDCRRDRKNN